MAVKNSGSWVTLLIRCRDRANKRNSSRSLAQSIHESQPWCWMMSSAVSIPPRKIKWSEVYSDRAGSSEEGKPQSCWRPIAVGDLSCPPASGHDSQPSVHQIPLADHILVLGTEGKIIQQGTFADLNASPGFIQSLLVEEKTEDRGDRPADGKAPAEKSTSALPADLSNELPTKAGSDSAVYQYYVQAIGYARFAIFIVLLSITAFFSAFPGTNPRADGGLWS